MYKKLIFIYCIFTLIFCIGCSSVTRQDTHNWVKKRYGYMLESANSDIMQRNDGAQSEAFCIPAVECTIIFVYNGDISTNPTVKGCIGYFNTYVFPEDRRDRCKNIQKILEEGNAIPKGLEMKLKLDSPVTTFDIGYVGGRR